MADKQLQYGFDELLEEMNDGDGYLDIGTGVIQLEMLAIGVTLSLLEVSLLWLHRVAWNPPNIFAELYLRS